MTNPAQLDDLTRYRIRKLAAELRELAPDILDTLLDHPEHGPLLAQALDAGTARWTCPLCGAYEHSDGEPDGWIIVRPFTRVASCRNCAPLFRLRLRRQLEGLDS